VHYASIRWQSSEVDRLDDTVAQSSHLVAQRPSDGTERQSIRRALVDVRVAAKLYFGGWVVDENLKRACCLVSAIFID
jgi:hypothetical protein